MRPNIFPVLRYGDAHVAIDWLTHAFGFDTHVKHVAPDGSVAHAELIRGAGIVMIGSAGPASDIRVSDESCSTGWTGACAGGHPAPRPRVAR